MKKKMAPKNKKIAKAIKNINKGDQDLTNTDNIEENNKKKEQEQEQEQEKEQEQE